MPTPHRPAASAATSFSEADLDTLQALLDRVPAPLEPLDVSMVDGYLCGVLVQPRRVAEADWLRHITDVDGRELPRSWDATALHALVRRRHAELDRAIGARQWFDPWVFELDSDDDDDAADDGPVGLGDTPHAGGEEGDVGDEDDSGGALSAASSAVYPWVAGFVTALEHFPALMRFEAERINPSLLLLYRHLDPDDLEDADELLAEMEALEPPADVGVAVEELVRATLLLADVARPQASTAPAKKRPGGPPRGGGRPVRR